MSVSTCFQLTASMKAYTRFLDSIVLRDECISCLNSLGVGGKVLMLPTKIEI